MTLFPTPVGSPQAPRSAYREDLAGCLAQAATCDAGMVDLFAGAGGLSLGLEAAGFPSVLAVECDPDACKTYAHAFPKAHLLSRRIEGVSFSALAGRVALVAGGPPCQPFSSGGKRLAQGDQRDMIPEFLRVVGEICPAAFLMENVPGLAGSSHRRYLERFVKQAEHLGYLVAWKVLTAADYGVPQKRQRLFVVGSRSGGFLFPAPTHVPRSPDLAAGNFLDPRVVIGEPNPSKVFYAKNPDLRPDPYDGHIYNGGGRPIDPDDLCPTILATAGGNKTPFLDGDREVPGYHRELSRGGFPRSGELPGARRITAEEAAIVQTFPRDFVFRGSRSSRYRQVGNAVPPLLAQRVGEALKEHLQMAANQPPARDPREAQHTG